MDDIADIFAAMTGTCPPDPRATQILVCDGTSLCLINGVAPAADAYGSVWYDPNGVLMLEGLKAPDGLAIALQGPQGGSYDTAVPATGYGPATFRGLQTMGFWISIALRRRRAQMALASPRILTGCNAQGGMAIEAFDDDSPTTGAQGARLITNMQFWLSEGVQVLGADFGTVPYDILIQGDENKTQTEAQYTAALRETRLDRAAAIAAITGNTPLICTVPTGGFTDTRAGTWEFALSHVRATLDLGGLVLAPMYPYLLADNNAHPSHAESKRLADLCAWHLAMFEAGRPVAPLVPVTRKTGAQLVLDYSAALGGDRLAFDASGKYDAYGGCEGQGFEVTGTAISAVTLSSDRRAVVIDCTAAPTGWSYAYQRADMRGSAVGSDNYGAMRGLLRTETAIRPVIDPGASLWRWACTWKEVGL